MIDAEGYRLNVGIILCNAEGRLFWAKRIGQPSWQFPQGGIQEDESPEQAMFRELTEEIGLRPEHVQIIGSTRGWLRYRLPKRLIRVGCPQVCIGQKQIWFLLRMRCDEAAVQLNLSERPEFDHWQWVDYWYPLRAVVSFKRHVYWQALHELEPLLAKVIANEQRQHLSQLAQTACIEAKAQPLTHHLATLHIQHVTDSQNPVITRMLVTSRRYADASISALALTVEQPTAPAASERSRWPRR